MSALADRICFAEINENFRKTVVDDIPAIQGPLNFGAVTSTPRISDHICNN